MGYLVLSIMLASLGLAENVGSSHSGHNQPSCATFGVTHLTVAGSLEVSGIQLAADYATCEKQCRPSLDSCLARTPESRWDMCRSVYFSCLDGCMPRSRNPPPVVR